MKFWLILAAAFFGLLAAAIIIARIEWAEPAMLHANSQTSGKRVPVIVELFTSEGCSSCPPADEALSKLERTQPVAEAEVIALGEHVDYWNYIGWTDPFSSAAFSDRQNEYMTAFGRDGAYTPQMVVDGKAEFVGSNWSKAIAAIAEAARAPKAEVQISSAAKSADSISIDVRATNLPISEGVVDFMLGITETDLASQVSRGENAGRRLQHRTVVRKLLQIGTGLTGNSTVTLEKNWKRENLRAVAFLQERKTRRILGASSIMAK
jgi:hypothetical protein